MKVFTHKPLETSLPELTAETGPNGRYYTTPEGNVYPSITTVLGILSVEHLAAWRERVGEAEAKAISEHAANRGTDLHACIEDHLENRIIRFPANKKSKVKLMFKRMKNILGDIDNIIIQEAALFSDTLRVAGRCDCIGEYQGVLSIIDFKSSGKAKKKDWILSYFLQATGYSLMLEELTGIVVPQIVIMIAGEDDCSSQVFVEDRTKYIEQLKYVRQQFDEQVAA